MLIGSVIFIIFKNVIGPITKLQNGANVIGKGDLVHKINIICDDEVGSIAGSFNEMAKKLEKSYSFLEKKVKKRTEDLEKLKDNLEELVLKRTK